MEHLIVKYPDQRPVYIDGVENGETNESIRVETGTHVIDLGSPADYQPESIEVAVVDTNVIEPMTVEFEPA